MASALLMSQICFAVSVYSEALNIAQHVESVRSDVVDNLRSNPRFWSHGWF